MSPDRQSEEPVPDVCIDCVLLQSRVNTLQEEVVSVQNQMQTMQQTLQNQMCEVSSRVSNLQYYVQWLWNKQVGFYNIYTSLCL